MITSEAIKVPQKIEEDHGKDLEIMVNRNRVFDIGYVRVYGDPVGSNLDNIEPGRVEITEA